MAPSPDALVTRWTPIGTAALATIAVRGANAREIAKRLFRDGNARLDSADDRPLYGFFGGAIRDDVVLRIHGDEAHIHAHGGEAIVEALIEAIVALGARRVTWQEYLRSTGATETQVEATEALAQCSSARAVGILLDQRAGALDRAFEAIASAPPLERPALAWQLLRWAPIGARLTFPWRVALFGQTNVGKSSLLNALVGYDRAIVANAPGVTRDVLRATTALDGWLVEFQDGAGFRQTSNPIERAGQSLWRERLADADLRIFVVDLSVPPAPADVELIREFRPRMVVGAKADLPTAWASVDSLDAVCSSKTGEGIGDLALAIIRRLVPAPPTVGAAVPFTPRQVDWLRQWTNVEGSARATPDS